jgi:hypothetical protein
VKGQFFKDQISLDDLIAKLHHVAQTGRLE